MKPKASIVATGTELTRGETHDRNGPWLATHLTTLGIDVDRVVLAPDRPEVLRAAIRSAVQDSDLVILSGGLGPTADDHTTRLVAEVLRRDVVRDPEAERRMRKRVLRRVKDEAAIPQNFFKQAEVVEGSEVLLNPVGLAPGMWIEAEEDRAAIVVLPGVPRELEALYEGLVAPRLLERFALQAPRIFRAKIFGHGESWVEERVQNLGIRFEHLEYGISAKPGELLLKFVAHDAEAGAHIETVAERLQGEFGDDLMILPEGFESGDANRDSDHGRRVHELLLRHTFTVATAESCTGGMIGKALTEHAGSSAYFRGAVVAYHNDVKQRLLGVPEELLDTVGAVSSEVCAAMARGARDVLQSDFAVATTGIAGPDGGSDEKPVGLVYIGLAGPTDDGEANVERHVFLGDRAQVRRRTEIAALELLRRSVREAR